ncbi:MAG: peroxiredoxin family protein [Gemmatimonas sp.]
MTSKQQWSIVGAVVALMAVGLFAASRLMSDELMPVNIGSKAPVFAARTVDTPSTVKTLNDYKGDVVLLNIWATNCIPCRVEMPSIDSLYRELAPKGLKVVALSTDAPNMDQAIRDFVKEYNLSFDILYDPEQKINQQYQIFGYPYTFIISRDGVIHKKWIGDHNWNTPEVKKLVEQLLAQSA